MTSTPSVVAVVRAFTEAVNAQAYDDASARLAVEGPERSGRIVQRWVETGEAAGELPVRISFAVEGGLITRLELVPG